MDAIADMRKLEPGRGRWDLFLVIALGISVPLFGTLYLGNALPDWSLASLPLHSTLEVAGAAFGFVLATIILFSQQKTLTSRRMWIACALVSMGVLDICHSCVPTGISFVWLHSVAVLAGGVFFALVWLPERDIARGTALAVTGMVLLGSILLGVLSGLYPAYLPAMVVDGSFTPIADALNLIGGGLTLLAGLHFAIRYFRDRETDELLFLLLCMLFGGPGVIFHLSGLWQAGWWLWHVLRFGAYGLAFWLALFSYRASEDALTRDRSKQAIAIAGGDYALSVVPRSDQDELGVALQSMTRALKDNRDKVDKQSWLQTGLARLNDVMRGGQDIIELSGKVITELTTRLNAQIGAFYVISTELEDKEKSKIKNQKSKIAKLTGSYAFTKRKNLSHEFRLGEGLVGQAALEKQRILLRNVPADYMQVNSSIVQGTPRFVCVAPFLFEDEVRGVVEIGSVHEITDRQLEYLDQALTAVAVAVQTAQSRTELSKALSDSRALSEELQAQQEELKASNEELEGQTQRLKQSEERLRVQQEELQVTNEELEEKGELLERRNKEIEEKAEELALASKYKSEFLANMSHELRTPLNSLLLLAQGLAQNKTGNLSKEQVESAQIIYDGGNDLLNLINEILDLSKIEAGRMELHLGTVRVSDLAEGVQAAFKHMAEQKKLSLDVKVTEDAPTEITSDRQRIDQVIRNLMSNAIKFTDQGGVSVIFDCRLPIADRHLESRNQKSEIRNVRVAENKSEQRVGVQDAEWQKSDREIANQKSKIKNQKCLALSVTDTGIGIAPEQRRIIFEAFQQADGGTSRKYGGTGLGLSITRELANLLGGEVRLESEPGKGSTFTLYLPLDVSAERKATGETAPVEFTGDGTGTAGGVSEETVAVPVSGQGTLSEEARRKADALRIEDDRAELASDDRTILVIEDDPRFSRLLLQKCHEKDFKCLAAPTGEEGLELAAKHLPSAVLLDIRLPGMDGWAVLSALKDDTRTRHIPVHVVSVEGDSTEARSKGAVGHAPKPLNMEALEETFQTFERVSAGKTRRVLVVEDDPAIRRETVRLIADADVAVDEAGSGAEAMEAVRATTYDCMVLDLGLPDMDGNELLRRLSRDGVDLPPVIVNTARDLTRAEETDLREHAGSIVIKDVRSQERLLDEVSLFLHRVVSQMPETKRRIIRDLHDTDSLLQGRKVLVVDDDMRTTFAMSRFLADRGMKPLKAENGERALRLLKEHPDVSLVLMDIMMPVMDGYECMKQIRAQERFRKLPIICLTAKAMPEDRQKCLEAGANDYMPKPVDEERLVSMMRVWLCR